ncbi:hypothetical protein KIF24_25255 [Micromonospora sp. Llam7]|uniref:hypothetical protein n=1 Tax=Micromonospora tarapacensis TaxID=2835305 RepID=UPI001C83EDC0|nr:hypothetical protein [Micromonospora tarapacensis]MBX7269006.1 hypothetical protein [Micromonospora tarapacensis]
MTGQPVVEATPTVALAADAAGDLAQTAGESSGGSPVMYFGIAMVAAGALLIGLLLHRSRRDRKGSGDKFEFPVPRNPGGTTYRSGGGAPIPPGPGGVPVPPTGQVYGAGRPGTPGVYGGTPAPRPSGGVYGARPADSGDQSRATPPGTSAHPAVPPTSAPPAVPTPAPPTPGQPGRLAPPPAGGEADDSGYGRGLPG